MRLYELSGSSFFYCSAKRYCPQDVVEPISTYPLGAALEGCLEHRRPERALTRSRCLYLLPQPVEAPYVYLVSPIGQIDRHHTSWLTLLADTALANVGEIDAYATGYWSGDPRPEDRHAPFEIRASKVIIIERVGGYELGG